MGDSSARKTADSGREAAPIHRLENAYYLLWAYPSGEEDNPFEVSKEVVGPLQPACETSPYCPDERLPRIVGRRGEPSGEAQPHIASVVEYERNPNFKGVTDCPYRFKTKEECYRDINIKAMTRALFDHREVSRVSNFLRALGYRVEAERIPESGIDGTRILKMHGQIYNFHETRFEVGPGQMVLCMIRSSVGGA